MDRADVIRLRHMLDAVRDSISFLEGVERDALDERRMLTLSLVKCVEILGEAASRVSEHVRVRHPEVPWRAIVGMRNHLIHAYYDVNLDILWQTVREDLPPLIPALEEILTTTDELPQ